MPFARQREVRQQSVLRQAELSFWPYSLPDYGSSCNVLRYALWGNPFVVLFLHGHSRTTDLYQMAVSLDSFFLGTARHSLCHYQSDETRDTRPVTNAGSAKHMVHSPCHRIYVLLLCIGLCFYNRIDRVVPP